MATKKDNLPLTLDQENDSTGTITYANEVIAIIAGVAANEVEGVAGMCSGGGITEVFGRNKNITKGVKVELGTEEAAVDISSRLHGSYWLFYPVSFNGQLFGKRHVCRYKL